ncbi:MAG TPA: winged helix-turn-helix transcriptional regulator [Candidatus Thermoplasmatota archaeon]|nr:winged helix-turn-helix transcriptional regulator [Candidatus Thermoplasmatota archaeon]
MSRHSASPKPDAALKAAFRGAKAASVLHGDALLALLSRRPVPGEAHAWRDACIRGAEPILAPWCLELLFVLSTEGERRFSELQAALPGVSSRTLTDKLASLQAEGLVEKHVTLEGARVRIRYRLTRDGKVAALLAGPLMTFMNREAGLRRNLAE